jgi:hypothetical protein
MWVTAIRTHRCIPHSASTPEEGHVPRFGVVDGRRIRHAAYLVVGGDAHAVSTLRIGKGTPLE